MNTSLLFLRLFFVCLSTTFVTIFFLSIPTDNRESNLGIGMGVGLLFGALLICLDLLFRKSNLRSFLIATLGIFFGYLMGQGLVFIFEAMAKTTSISIILQPQTLDLIKVALFLTSIYLGMTLTVKGSHELSLSIPFIRFTPTAQKKKDLLVDISVLADSRILDFCATGILNYQLILPRFIVKELYAQAEQGEEGIKIRAKKCLDVIKKLEALSHLELRFEETDFPELKDLPGKLLRLARLLDANILSADLSKVQIFSMEGIAIINIHALSNALKPLMQTGEFIKIKIQRYGKEPKQGVGYLEDGSMVVVNGGGDYIGDLIRARVLSVKHTASGRMIFCNANDQEDEASDYLEEVERSCYSDRHEE